MAVSGFRELRSEEIRQLEAQGNICADWRIIRVVENFLTENIWHCHFIRVDVDVNATWAQKANEVLVRTFELPAAETAMGKIYLERFEGRPVSCERLGHDILTGIYRSTITSSYIYENAAVYNCPRVLGSVIGMESLVYNSSLSADPYLSQFGNGQEIPVGIETGGRNLRIHADLDFQDAMNLLRNPKDSKTQRIHLAEISEYIHEIEFPYTVIGSQSEIVNSLCIENAYIEQRAQITNVQELSDSQICSSLQNPTIISSGTIIRSSVLCEGVQVSDYAVVQNSMLFERSSVSEHAVVNNSIIGTHSHIAKGEVTSAFLGPLSSMHHQSLLIAALVPGGRVNVGAGALVGSNHSSRSPDQECWLGEGVFIGLGAKIKYPANFLHAPYSVIASGVVCPPQKLEMPFSLLCETLGDRSADPANCNVLIPGWCIYKNMYALIRSEFKFARRSSEETEEGSGEALSLFRSEIRALVEKALGFLEHIKLKKDCYLPGDIEGIGQNILTEEHRNQGIEAYRFIIRYMNAAEKQREIVQEAADRLYKCSQEALSTLQNYQALRSEILALCTVSRERDRLRGRQIIPDYEDTHPTLENDPVIRGLQAEIAQENTKIEDIYKHSKENTEKN